MKINSKVIWLNLLVLSGLILDYVIPHMSDYQSILSPHIYSVMVAVLPILNIILRMYKPNVEPISKKDDDNAPSQ